MLVVPNIFEFNRKHSNRNSFDSRGGLGSQLFSQTAFVLAGLGVSSVTALLHEEPNAELLDHWESRLSFRPMTVVAPVVTGNLCEDALGSSQVRHSLTSLPCKDLLFWGATQQAQELSKLLGVPGPSNAAITTAALLSNRAVNNAIVQSLLYPDRRVFTRMPYISLPAEEDAFASIPKAMLSCWPSILVKPGATWGGRGTTKLVASDAEIAEKLANMPLPFSNGHCVIEPFLGSEEENTSPSVDWMPDIGNGRGKAIAGKMILNGFSCVGAAYGKGLFSDAPDFKREIVEYVERLADLLNCWGYSEWFDVDFLQTHSGNYVNEVNVRHTGGTVPIRLANHLWGEKWQEKIGCANIDGIVTKARSIADLSIAGHTARVDVEDARRFVITAFERLDDCRSKVSFWVSADSCEEAISLAKSLRDVLVGHSFQ